MIISLIRILLDGLHSFYRQINSFFTHLPLCATFHFFKILCFNSFVRKYLLLVLFCLYVVENYLFLLLLLSENQLRFGFCFASFRPTSSTSLDILLAHVFQPKQVFDQSGSRKYTWYCYTIV